VNRSLGLSPLAQSRRRVASAVAFLFRDDFTTDESAPITTPRTAEPTGVADIVDTGNKLYISGSEMTCLSPTGTGNPRYVTEEIARSVGVASMTLQQNSASRLYVGFGTATQIATPSRSALYKSGDTLYVIDYGATFIIGGMSSHIDYDTAIVLRTNGAFYFIRGGSLANWTLVWVSSEDADATLRSYISWRTNSGTVNSLRVSQLPSPYDTDFGIATVHHAGTVASGTTVTATADFLRYFYVTTLPTAGRSEKIRKQDVNNYWEVAINSSGDIALNEIVAGSPVNRANSSGVVSNGSRVCIVAVDETIKVFVGNASAKFIYALASNFKTETDGGTDGDGAISDEVTFPREPDSTALDAVVDA